jgi:acetyltransferase-like isoleucine patch superfamily enzyme
MSLSIFMDGGLSLAKGGNLRRRLWMRWGRYLAARHAGVHLDPTCVIHPEARINPRGSQLTIGARSSVAPGACIQGPVTIGENCTVQIYSVLVGAREGTITIGNGVRIAPHVMIFAANHIFADTDTPIYKQGCEYAPIVIEDDVWIAGNVMITAGVRIGRGSVIGAGAVVTKDIPAWSVAVGVPAVVVKTRKAQEPSSV